MQRIRFAIAVGTALFLAVPSAQGQFRRGHAAMLTSSRLPAGACQVWIPGRSAHRQPAPMDCGTARAYAPSGSRIIYGKGHAKALHEMDESGVDPRTGEHRGDQGRLERQRDREHGQWERERERRERALERTRGRHGDDDGDDNDDDGDNDDNDDGDANDGQHGQVDGRSDGSRDYRQIPFARLGAIRFR
jgi:hypothetical protein